MAPFLLICSFVASRCPVGVVTSYAVCVAQHFGHSREIDMDFGSIPRGVKTTVLSELMITPAPSFVPQHRQCVPVGANSRAGGALIESHDGSTFWAIAKSSVSESFCSSVNVCELRMTAKSTAFSIG